MYASYNMLYNNCAQTPFTAYTDSSRFFCASLPLQKQVRKSIQTDQVFPLNVPCTHDASCDITDPDCQYKCSIVPPKKVEHKKPQKKTPLFTTKPPVEHFTMLLSSDKEQTNFQDQDMEKLLPVMDPEFNLREICKQCILLEDHLSHDEKRCFDCCVKHFLTIEALAEEAITLGSCRFSSKLQTLPSRVRTLQYQWHQNPDKNAHAVSQELRKIRKDFQLDAFDVVFRASSCKDGVCKIK